MIDTVAFIKRIETLFDHYAINAAVFADQIGVQRSSLSHLLSGRNKPSLDFILKIVDTYPEVELDWILKGNGSFPKETSENRPKIQNQTSSFSLNPLPSPAKEKERQGDLFNQVILEPLINKGIELKMDKGIQNSVEIPDEIEKIIFFYKNGKFKIFTPK